MNTIPKEKITEIVLKLESLCCTQNYVGYDPYDIKGSPLFMKALSFPRKPFHKNLQRKLFLAPLVIGDIFFPFLLRKIFRIRHTVNAKGLALFTKGYFNLFKLTSDDKWLIKAEKLLAWLLEIRSKNYSEPCWGYPFDWDSGVDVPKGTPASVVTAAVFDAFWTAWNVTNHRKYYDVCHGICNFFMKSLNISVLDDETVCFSYTPLDDFQVHNANLLVAECLLEFGKASNKSHMVDLGRKAANFAILEQNEEGSLYYWSSNQDHRNNELGRIDHYHSGFEIRCLYGIWKASGEKKFKEALDRYYQFYVDNFIDYSDNSFFPKMYPYNKYPINIHSCAESIILNATLFNEFSKAKLIMQGLIAPILKQMKRRDGWFSYMIRKYGPFCFRSNIIFMRWGQAWMFLALTHALLKLK